MPPTSWATAYPGTEAGAIPANVLENRDRTARRYARLPLEQVVAGLNPVLRGWGGYFRYGNSAAKFSRIDGYVNERLAILASAKHGLQGRNWVTRFDYQWCTQLGVHRLSGTTRPTTAYAGR